MNQIRHRCIKATLAVIMLFLIQLNTGCVNPLLEYEDYPTEESSTEIETAPEDENYGYGVSFSFIDHTDTGISLSYSLTKSNSVWYLNISGINAKVTGSKMVSEKDAQEFFYYIVNNSNIPGIDAYNKSDDAVKEGWWFSLNAQYEKKNIDAYGYMRHTSDYDDIRTLITEYLNKMFENVGE